MPHTECSVEYVAQTDACLVYVSVYTYKLSKGAIPVARDLLQLLRSWCRGEEGGRVGSPIDRLEAYVQRVMPGISVSI